MGCRQAVRHGILIPAFVGSNPATPANNGNSGNARGCRCYFRIGRIRSRSGSEWQPGGLSEPRMTERAGRARVESWLRPCWVFITQVSYGHSVFICFFVFEQTSWSAHFLFQLVFTHLKCVTHYDTFSKAVKMSFVGLFRKYFALKSNNYCLLYCVFIIFIV